MIATDQLEWVRRMNDIHRLHSKSVSNASFLEVIIMLILLKLPLRLAALLLIPVLLDCAGVVIRHHESAGNGFSYRLFGRIGCSCTRCHALPDGWHRCILCACAAYSRMAAEQSHGRHDLYSGLHSALTPLLLLCSPFAAFHRAEL